LSAQRPRLLVIDDGDRHIELMHRFLRDYDYATRCDRSGPCWSCEARKGCTLTHAHDLAEASEVLARTEVDVAVVDVAFDLPAARLAPSDETDLDRRRRLQGLDILRHLRRARGDLPVVLMTSREELEYEDAAVALEVDEFVTLAGAEAFDARALGLLVERIVARRRELPQVGGFAWGQSAAMKRLRRDALVMARTSLPVLVVGETGTGKSALAEQVLHAAAGRKGAFVAADLSAIPETLVAAELFGTARGAFSGAVDRAGLLERAHGGTLFLDEIGNLRGDIQRMLLTALEARRVVRLGETHARPVEFKLIAATHADLGAAVRAGTFRADLHARLNPSSRLTLPPLRERLGDLEELLAAFVQRTFAGGADRALYADFAARVGLAEPRPPEVITRGAPRSAPETVQFVFAPATLKALRAHRWPGNVRELQHVAASAAVFALADALRAAEEGRGAGRGARAIPIPARLVKQLLDGGEAPSARPGTHKTLHALARELERQHYQQLFAECDGDFAAMARRLLGQDGSAAARKVRLRFNQLGLRVRKS
jgi:DNA-binding NtrC family response regulator